MKFNFLNLLISSTYEEILYFYLKNNDKEFRGWIKNLKFNNVNLKISFQFLIDDIKGDKIKYTDAVDLILAKDLNFYDNRLTFEGEKYNFKGKKDLIRILGRKIRYLFYTPDTGYEVLEN